MKNGTQFTHRNLYYLLQCIDYVKYQLVSSLIQTWYYLELYQWFIYIYIYLDTELYLDHIHDHVYFLYHVYIHDQVYIYIDHVYIYIL